MRIRTSLVAVLAAGAALTAAPATSPAAPAAAAASAAAGYTAIVRDGIPLLHRREPAAATPKTGAGVTRSDFDGDGLDDIAALAEGTVIVRYSSAPHRDYLATEMPRGGCLCFGRQLATGDFDGDRYDDLAVADVQELDVPAGVEDAGGVWVLPGGPRGLEPGRVLHLNLSTPGVPGASARYDAFGYALATGDITGDGRDELAVGVPGKTIGAAREAGAVVVLKGSPSGIVTAGAQWTSQDSAGVPGAAGAGDRFGAGLAVGAIDRNRHAELLVGVPGEATSGAIVQFWGAAGGIATTRVTQATGAAATAAFDRRGTYLWDLGRSLAVTDTDGDGYGEVVTGLPSAQANSRFDVTGAVVTLKGNATGLTVKGLRVVSQDTLGVADTAEQGDGFGTSVAAGEVTGDRYGDILVGVPFEDVAGVADAGAVVLLKGSKDGVVGAGSQTVGQNTAGAPDAAERGDVFGIAVSLLNLNGTGGFDAVVGASGETRDAGGRGPGTGSVTTFGAGPRGFGTGYVRYGSDVAHEGLLVTGYGAYVNRPQAEN
ncbi:FG-GAP and VCBS repeat-containing protein [Spirilliplanes yamanashiensis]|uniref:FG-GAP repeat protein n=1 Tax=Spirilliplanes yamanashiensis TaxID=42233 RepID=A0A8J3YA80_9ACTN|nr:FG-GAP and VCBS repeat-containing protein [Spirilliplanes yamanashiensis]MDP9815950.1 hypothetical protein [Spirilliplanes yamanashiensis]GIJ04207.1 hypothetical protein Sya03_35590 [Spirilliplanes yamanashiensis]